MHLAKFCSHPIHFEMFYFQENLVSVTSPVCIAKAVKNEVEIEGMKQSHVIKL